MTVTIETLASGGDGVAHPEGFTVFVPHSAPGDVADVELTQVAKHYGRARIITLRQPGPDRVPTTCPLAAGCAGCQLQQVNYPAQLAAKQSFVRDGLERVGHLSGIEVRPTIGMDDPWRYRNKGEFTAAREDGRLRLGYRTEGGVDFLAVTECPIQHPLSIEILRATEEIANAFDLPLAQLITRVSPDGPSALAILVCWERHDRFAEAARALQDRVPGLVGVLWSQVRGRSVVRRSLAVPLIGQTFLRQRLGPWEYHVSAESFFQVNNIQGARLIELAREFAGDLPGRLFIDGYCGVGTFLIPLGSKASRSMGIEEHPIALQDAKENLAHYALHDARLFEGRVEVVFERLLRKGRGADVVVLDPPRKGVGRAVLESLPQLDVKRVVLISCDPATLGRDAGDLAALGYRIEIAQPIDMFPQTWHVETVLLAVKQPVEKLQEVEQ